MPEIDWDEVPRPDLIAALRAVLAMHRSVDGQDGTWTPADYCADDGFIWPCPTVRAIADALARPADVTTEGERR